MKSLLLNNEKPVKDAFAKIQVILVAKMGSEKGGTLSRDCEHKLVAKTE
jgi:hypothetical protein